MEKWHFAYHGMCPSNVRKLLDAGDLLAVCSKLRFQHCVVTRKTRKFKQSYPNRQYVWSSCVCPFVCLSICHKTVFY